MTPLDVDGLTAVSIGTVAFAVATLVSGLLLDQLQARGDGWWFGVCLSGLVLGLLGFGYCLRRRRQRLVGPAAAATRASLTDRPRPARRAAQPGAGRDR